MNYLDLKNIKWLSCEENYLLLPLIKALFSLLTVYIIMFGSFNSINGIIFLIKEAQIVFIQRLLNILSIARMILISI
jgi:hypothetical protein